MSREKDALIAVEKYGWKWENKHGYRELLVPPIDDPRRLWTGIWGEDGIPHYLPRYSEGEE